MSSFDDSLVVDEQAIEQIDQLPMIWHTIMLIRFLNFRQPFNH